MYAPTANGATDARPERTTPKIVISRPKVATTSASHSGPLLRALVDSSNVASPNIALATSAPSTPPVTCATTYTTASRLLIPPKTRSASVTTGLK